MITVIHWASVNTGPLEILPKSGDMWVLREDSCPRSTTKPSENSHAIDTGHFGLLGMSDLLASNPLEPFGCWRNLRLMGGKLIWQGMECHAPQWEKHLKMFWNWNAPSMCIREELDIQHWLSKTQLLHSWCFPMVQKPKSNPFDIKELSMYIESNFSYNLEALCSILVSSVVIKSLGSEVH